MRLSARETPKKPYVPRPERMVADARRWVRSLDLEPYWLQHIQSLRAGERIWLGWFEGPSARLGEVGHAEASIEAVAGGYRFQGVWTISPLRAFGEGAECEETFATGRFSIQGGQVLYNSDTDPRAGAAFANICRMIAKVEEEHERFGIKDLILGAPYFYNVLWRCQKVDAGGRTREGCYGPVPFDFDAMRAPVPTIPSTTIRP